MQAWMIKPLLFQADGLQRWKARGLQWSENEFYVVEHNGSGSYVATVTTGKYRSYLGEALDFACAVMMCQSHHEQQLSEWLTPMPQGGAFAASLPEKNQK